MAKAAKFSVVSSDVLRLLKRIKNHTPADGCMVCRHKDREHGAERCYSCEGEGRTCLEFVSTEQALELLEAALKEI